jgi:hypothetical protein
MAKQSYQRIDLATEQLDVALELFLSRRSFVSALTLAGAAEEILGKALGSGLNHVQKATRLARVTVAWKLRASLS